MESKFNEEKWLRDYTKKQVRMGIDVGKTIQLDIDSTDILSHGGRVMRKYKDNSVMLDGRKKRNEFNKRVSMLKENYGVNIYDYIE
jgi:hypothetical protein